MRVFFHMVHLDAVAFSNWLVFRFRLRRRFAFVESRSDERNEKHEYGADSCTDEKKKNTQAGKALVRNNGIPIYSTRQ